MYFHILFGTPCAHGVGPLALGELGGNVYSNLAVAAINCWGFLWSCGISVPHSGQLAPGWWARRSYEHARQRPFRRRFLVRDHFAILSVSHEALRSDSGQIGILAPVRVVHSVFHGFPKE